MAKRGRKSAASHEVALLIEAETPADAPYELTDAEANIWRGITNAMPAAWFPRESLELLAAYCRACAMADFVSREINRYEMTWLAKDGGIERLQKLTGIRDREVRTAMSLATRLRLTNQARYDPRSAARRREDRPAGHPVPWE